MVNGVTNFWNFKHKINIQNIKHEKYISPMEYKSFESLHKSKINVIFPICKNLREMFTSRQTTLNFTGNRKQTCKEPPKRRDKR